MDFTVFSPFTNKYHAWNDLASYTDKQFAKHQSASSFKATAIALGIFTASVIVGLATFGVGGVALFRTLVGRYVKPLPPGGKVANAAAVALPNDKRKALEQILKTQQQKFPQNERLPKLKQFLLQDSYTYNKKDYDLGYEDFFGVGWLDPNRDRKFLQEMNKKYPKAIQLLQDPAIDARNRFGLNDSTRLANNNIYGLFLAAQEKKCPEIQALLKEAMICCILRDFSK